MKKLMLASAIASTYFAPVMADHHVNFNRVSTFLVCSQLEPNCNIDTETSAEIAYTNKDGSVLVYTNSPAETLGFVDIADVAAPKGSGEVKLGGEPTSVTVKDNLALVAVNTSKDYVDVGGNLQVFDLASKEKKAELDLGGQPDSIAISPDGHYAIVAIENERDEDLNDGVIPQMPAGFVVIVDTKEADPSNWTTKKVDVTGLATVAGDDPEPEYVDINENNIALVTLQENNHIILIDLAKGEVTNHFSAGSVSLDNIDVARQKPGKIDLTGKKADMLREPDGASWVDNNHLATANEGDYKGGSRNVTIFNTNGNVVWDSGDQLEHEAVRLGHYPEKRAGKKGNEPENVEVGQFGDTKYMFVNSERASLVFVYNVNDPANPKLVQTLPAGVGPEGVIAMPSKNAVAVASEVDERKNKMRASVAFYTLGEQAAQYPTLKSADVDGRPIAFSALSGLAAGEGKTLYSVEDSFFGSNRIFEIDASQTPAIITKATALKDSQGVLAGMKTVDGKKLVNDDKTVNVDLEGVSVAKDGGFWVVSEGSGTVGDEKKPFKYQNMLMKVSDNGDIVTVATLPKAMNDVQLRFGFEGVTEADDGKLYVAVQRPWNKEANPRIGIFDPASESWTFVFYPLDKKASQFGGWVGLSDITALGNGEFLVLERDNQGGPDAAIKRIYKVNLNDAKAGDTVEKTLVRDLLPELKKANGIVAEKVEGMAVTKDGTLYIVNDNDGVDDNSGETQLINLGKLN